MSQMSQPMSQPMLSSFDPLATHPFTNNSGLLPNPTPPSMFPHSIPSASLKSSHGHATSRTHSGSAQMHAPQPRRVPAGPSANPNKTSAGGPRPIFVPFRPERSSPELDDILLRKRVSDVLTNKQQPWSIDQSTVPMAARTVHGGQAR